MDNYTKNDSAALRVQALLCDKQEMGEVSGEISLPDYLPEVKRLMRVSATVTPPARYVGAANTELSGSVDFCILYTGNDGALYSTSHTSEYRIGIPTDLPNDAALGEGLVCDADILPEPCNARVLAPRKLSLKCRLRARMRIYGNRLIENGDMIAGIAAEKLFGSCDVAEHFCGVGEPLLLHDEIICDTQSEDVRVIYADGKVLIMEAVAGSGSINCRGEVALKLLCAHDSTGLPPSQLMRRIPFESSIEVEGCEVNCMASAFGTCTDVSVTVEEGRILCDLAIVLEGRAERNRNLTYVRDAYTLEATCESRTDFLSLPHSRSCICANFSVGSTLTAEEAGLRAGVSVIDAHQVRKRLVVFLCNAPQGVGGGGEANGAFSLCLFAFIANLASRKILDPFLCSRYDRNGNFAVNAKAFAVGASATANGGEMDKRIGKCTFFGICLVAVGNFHLLRGKFACIIRECEMYAASTA